MITAIKAAPDNVAQLQRIGRQTFLEAFSEINTEADMAKYLEENFSLDKLNADLSNQLSLFYFAVLNGQVIGYLKLNTGQAQTDIKDNQTLEIERIYVLQAFQGKKIGQLLLNKAYEIAQEMNSEYIWLGVWDKNDRAISFYQKNVFIAFDQHAFILGMEKQNDILMKRDIIKD